MYIVGENDKEKVDEVAKIVGERSAKLAAVIEEIITSSSEGKLTVEIIEQAITILEEREYK